VAPQRQSSGTKNQDVPRTATSARGTRVGKYRYAEPCCMHAIAGARSAEFVQAIAVSLTQFRKPGNESEVSVSNGYGCSTRTPQ
jgi:hypothetical protein